MKKFYLPIAILMMAVLLGTTACSTAITAPTVKLGYVTNEYQSYDSVDMTCGFVVENPNDVPIVVSSLAYALTVNDVLMANKTVTPMVIVPAKSTATVTSLNIVSYKDVVTQYVLIKGMDTPTAAFAALPIYKLIGGAYPPIWATGVATALMGGPAVADLADPAKYPDAIKAYGVAKGTFDTVMGKILQIWPTAPSAPCTYKVKGSMVVSAGNTNVEVPLDLSWTREQ